MMSNFQPHMLTLIIPFVVGIVLGCCFFYALWLTVDKGLQSGHPAVWFLGGILARMGTAVGVFYWVSDNDIWRLVASLIGFVIGRILMTKYLTKINENQLVKKAIRHAP
ncbi:ATP synthase subunit I [Paraglaciecola sp. 20A4]|uniref:ATP synthase subunit I n=1 Tax=Paraglaciecola sp. 20A4 TaxID=2687288 RepID=UPI00140AE96C|nr:ATP synthase subunit I [Paraglaciecola sp. 20A4]